MRCGITSSCQSAATSELVKCAWACVHREAALYQVPDLYLYAPMPHPTMITCWSCSTESSPAVHHLLNATPPPPNGVIEWFYTRVVRGHIFRSSMNVTHLGRRYLRVSLPGVTARRPAAGSISYECQEADRHRAPALLTVKPISQLRFDYDTTMNRRCHDAFDYDGSDQNYDLRSIWLRYDYDTTTTKIDMLIFCSRRIASNGSRRARYVVVGS